MEDIKIKSVIDFKTYFNISLLIGFRFRTVLIMLAFVVLICCITMNGSALPLWTKALVGLVILVIYAGIALISIYISCRRNMKQSAYLTEPLLFTINGEKIDVSAATISSTSGWEYFIKLIERERYFLLLTAKKTFHYFPKAGFESDEEITMFKNMVKAKGIEMTAY